MVTAVIAATLAAVLYSLWIRRHTWRSRWETDASVTVALLGCGMLFVSPWASTAVGPHLHRAVGWWNIEDLLGHLCLIAAGVAVIRHSAARLANDGQIADLFRRRVEIPVRLGIALMVATFVIADAEYQPHWFPATIDNGWLGVYWLVTCGLVGYLLHCGGRVLWVLRADSRSRKTVDRYLIAFALCGLANAIQLATAWTRFDATLTASVFAGSGGIVFSIAAARSWQAKVDWFAPGPDPSPDDPVALH